MKAEQTNWSTYAPLFSQITTRYQMAMYEDASSHLSGKVIDCGSGSCKLAPYLSSKVTEYLGVDANPEMVDLATQTLRKLNRDSYSVRCQYIESSSGLYHAAVSLQSYYSWEQPERVLACMHRLLPTEGTLVIASANSCINIDQLLDNVSRDWLSFPGWEIYMHYNRRLAAMPGGNFVSLDCLIGQLRAVDFSVMDAHTRLFDGGLNFVVAKKKRTP